MGRMCRQVGEKKEKPSRGKVTYQTLREREGNIIQRKMLERERASEMRKYTMDVERGGIEKQNVMNFE